MNSLFIFDLDGTCADMKWRHVLAGKEPNKKNWKKFKKWLRKVQSKKMLLKDRPVPGMRDMAILLKKHAIYLTARNESYRDVTKKWLKRNGFPNLPLHMRKSSDRSAAGVLKEKVILDILHKSKKFVHVVLIDDDPKGDIYMACRKNGWTFIKAKSGC